MICISNVGKDRHGTSAITYTSGSYADATFSCNLDHVKVCVSNVEIYNFESEIHNEINSHIADSRTDSVFFLQNIQVFTQFFSLDRRRQR